MYIKVLLVFIILLLIGFFFLHYQNPGAVTFVLTKNYSYTLPATLFIFIGFIAGVVLAVLNSLIVDVKKSVRGLRTRRKLRFAAETDADYHKGVDALVTGHTAEARRLLEKAVNARPNDTGLIISLSDTYLKEGNPGGAMKVLEEGITSNPGSVGILVAMGDAAKAAGEQAGAARAYGEAVSKDPKNLRALKELRGIKADKGVWGEAAELQKGIIALTNDAVAKEREKALLTGFLFEEAMMEAGEDNFAKALSRLDAVIKNDRTFLPAEIRRGDVLKMQGGISEAVRSWEGTLKSHPLSAPLLLRLEDAYLKESSPEKILDRYKRELASRPDDANLRMLLSRLYLRLEMVDNAIEELERLHNDGLESGYTRALLGEAYLRRNQAEKASTLFKKALGVDSEMLPPFACEGCGVSSAEWLPRCPSCGLWGMLKMEAPGR